MTFPEDDWQPYLMVPGAGEGFAARLDAAELHHVARFDPRPALPERVLQEDALLSLTTEHVVLRLGGARPVVFEVWLHRELGVPVRAAWNGVTAELVSLETIDDQSC